MKKKQDELSEYATFFFKYKGYLIKHIEEKKTYKRGVFWDAHRNCAKIMMHGNIPSYIELVKD